MISKTLRHFVEKAIACVPEYFNLRLNVITLAKQVEAYQTQKNI
ncbi:hypothetical protein [Nostoc sp.]